MQDAPDPDESIAAAERVRDRYRAVWTELHDEPILRAGDRQAIRARVRRLNDLGYSVDVALDPTAGTDVVRLRMRVTTRRFHAREIERRTKIRALEGQAQLLLNDLNEYSRLARAHPRPAGPARGGGGPLAATTSTGRRSPGSPAPSGRSATSSRRIPTSSSRSGTCPRRPAATSGSTQAIEAYVALGAPAPETPADGVATRIGRARPRTARRGRRRPDAADRLADDDRTGP